MKVKIINMNYDYGRDGNLRILPEWAQVLRPWRVIGGGMITSFPTHAEAIAYADRLVREPK